MAADFTGDLNQGVCIDKPSGDLKEGYMSINGVRLHFVRELDHVQYCAYLEAFQRHNWPSDLSWNTLGEKEVTSRLCPLI